MDIFIIFFTNAKRFNLQTLIKDNKVCNLFMRLLLTKYLSFEISLFIITSSVIFSSEIFRLLFLSTRKK